MTMHHTLMGAFLNWLLHVFNYYTVIVIKNTLTDVSAFVFGFIVAIIFVCYLLKNVRILDDSSIEDIAITRMKKNGKVMKFISIPKPRLSVISAFVIFLNLLYAKLFKKPKVLVVNNRKVRIAWTITLFIIAAVCLFNVLLDSRVILPIDHNGNYGVFDTQGNLRYK